MRAEQPGDLSLPTAAQFDLVGMETTLDQLQVSLLPRWNFSWCFNLANLDLKYSSQREHLKGRSWVWRIMCSCR